MKANDYSDKQICKFIGHPFDKFKVNKSYSFRLFGDKVQVINSVNKEGNGVTGPYMSYDSFCINFTLTKKVIIEYRLYTRFYIPKYKEFFGEYKYEKIWAKEKSDFILDFILNHNKID